MGSNPTLSALNLPLPPFTKGGFSFRVRIPLLQSARSPLRLKSPPTTACSKERCGAGLHEGGLFFGFESHSYRAQAAISPLNLPLPPPACGAGLHEGGLFFGFESHSYRAQAALSPLNLPLPPLREGGLFYVFVRIESFPAGYVGLNAATHNSGLYAMRGFPNGRSVQPTEASRPLCLCVTGITIPLDLALSWQAMLG